jgi:hypothetical protein
MKAVYKCAMVIILFFLFYIILYKKKNFGTHKTMTYNHRRNVVLSLGYIILYGILSRLFEEYYRIWNELSNSDIKAIFTCAICVFIK